MPKRVLCPQCNAQAYETDHHCMACGADLVMLLAEKKRREDEEQQRLEAAAQFEAAKRHVIEAMAASKPPSEVYIALVNAGWAQEDARDLIKTATKGIDEVVGPDSTCPYCQNAVKPHSAFVVCSACRVPHHQPCWEGNGGCAVYGCSSETQIGADALALPASEMELRQEGMDALFAMCSALEVGIAYADYPTYLIAAKQVLDRVLRRTALATSTFWKELQEGVEDLSFAYQVWQLRFPPHYLEWVRASSPVCQLALQRYPALASSAKKNRAYLQVEHLVETAWFDASGHAELARQVAEWL